MELSGFLEYAVILCSIELNNAIFSGTSYQNSLAGHISIIYRQTVDILLVSIKGTAAAKWQMKISRCLCQYCRYWLQNFTVTLFQLYAKRRMTSMDSFKNELARQTAKSSFQNRPLHFARISVSLTDSDKFNWHGKSPILIKYFRGLEDCQFFCWFVVAPISSCPPNPLGPCYFCTEMESRMINNCTGLALQEVPQSSHFSFSWSLDDCDISPNLQEGHTNVRNIILPFQQGRYFLFFDSRWPLCFS